MGRWLTLIGLHQNRLSACKTGKRMPKDHSVFGLACRPPPRRTTRGLSQRGGRGEGSACRSPGRCTGTGCAASIGKGAGRDDPGAIRS